MQNENHSLEYLPGAPVPQAYGKQEQERTGSSTSRELTLDTRNKPSFIPVATSQDHDGMSQYSALNRMAASPQPVFHRHDQLVKNDDSAQLRIQVSTEDYTKQQHSAGPTGGPIHQLPHNGHVPLVYPNSGSTSVNYGMPGHGQISANIVMYPPSQVLFTQASNREVTTTKPQTIVPGIPSIPQVQNQPAPPATKVVHTGSSSASPLYSSHQQMPGQPSINAQVQIQTSQPAVLNTMPGVPQGLPQGIPKPPQGASPRLSHEMPHGGPQEDSRLASPRHFKNPEFVRQGGAPVTSGEVSDSLHNQQPPPQQVRAQPAPKMERASKSRGFAPVSRTMIGSVPANHQLRERLQNLANRQKTLTVKSGDQNVARVHQNKGESKEGKVHVQLLSSDSKWKKQ